MKIRYQFFIIIFVGLSLFILREDFLSVVKNISSSLNKEDKPSIQLEEEPLLLGQADTPGPLRVVNDLLNINSDAKLSNNNIIVLTNKNRKENGGLAPLMENSKLNLSASKKLQDMFDHQYFEHTSPTGVGVSDLGNEVGYNYILIGENLAMGNFQDDKALVDAWMASLGHRANILNKNYTEIGIAVGQGQFEGKNIWMAIQHFGTPRSICPVVDQVLYGIINANQSQIKEMEQDLILRKEMIDNGAVYEGSSRNEQVDQYNDLVNIYNDLIANTKEKIKNYNNQVQAFNFCLSGINNSD
ncbi:MAG: CAP domain-containing protein [Candidatus Paceibacterota bacterium]|jgi:uncharacterized protein YkwD